MLPHGAAHFLFPISDTQYLRIPINEKGTKQVYFKELEEYIIPQQIIQLKLETWKALHSYYQDTLQDAETYSARSKHRLNSQQEQLRKVVLQEILSQMNQLELTRSECKNVDGLLEKQYTRGRREEMAQEHALINTLLVPNLLYNKDYAVEIKPKQLYTSDKYCTFCRQQRLRGRRISFCTLALLTASSLRSSVIDSKSFKAHIFDLPELLIPSLDAAKPLFRLLQGLQIRYEGHPLNLDRSLRDCSVFVTRTRGSSTFVCNIIDLDHKGGSVKEAYWRFNEQALSQADMSGVLECLTRIDAQNLNT